MDFLLKFVKRQKLLNRKFILVTYEEGQSMSWWRYQCVIIICIITFPLLLLLWLQPDIIIVIISSSSSSSSNAMNQFLSSKTTTTSSSSKSLSNEIRISSKLSSDLSSSSYDDADTMLNNIRFDVFNITSTYSNIIMFDDTVNRGDNDDKVVHHNSSSNSSNKSRKVNSKKLRFIDCILSDCNNLTKLTYQRKPFILKNYLSVTSWPALSWDLWSIAMYKWIYLENVLTIRTTEDTSSSSSSSSSSSFNVFCTHLDSTISSGDASRRSSSSRNNDDGYIRLASNNDDACKLRPKTLKSMLLLDLLYSLRPLSLADVSGSSEDSNSIGGGDSSSSNYGSSSSSRRRSSDTCEDQQERIRPVTYLYSTNYRSLEDTLQASRYYLSITIQLILITILYHLSFYTLSLFISNDDDFYYHHIFFHS
jgi:hypothetical protein